MENIYKKRTNIPCPECNCKLNKMTPVAFINEEYYICPKCTAFFFGDNENIKNDKKSTK